MSLTIQDLTESAIQPAIDWTTNNFVDEIGGNTNLIVVDMASGIVGTETSVASITGMGGDGTVQSIIVSDQNGNLYFGHGTAGNRYCPVAKITETLSLIYTHGASSSAGPPTNDGLNDPAGLTVMKANLSWLVCVGSITLVQKTILILRGDTGAYLVGNNNGSSNYLSLGNHAWVLDEGDAPSNPAVAPGKTLANGNLAVSYIIAPSSTVLGFYCAGVFDLNPSSLEWFFAKIGTLVPSDIDSDWTTLNFGDVQTGLAASGVAVDQFDNGMLTFVAVTNAAVTYSSGTTYSLGDIVYGGSSNHTNFISLQNSNHGHTPASSPTFWRPMQMQYLIKVNTGPYSVSGVGSFGLAWKIPIRNFPTLLNIMGQSLINHFRYLYIENTEPVSNDCNGWIINTLTGSYTTFSLPGIQVTASQPCQASEDVTNSLVAKVTYLSTRPGAPTGRNGTASFTGHWARLYFDISSPSSVQVHIYD